MAQPTGSSGAVAEASRLQELAKRHLWMHFARQGAMAKVPVIVRGEGCYVFDEDGKRYFDGLAALFCVNLGHGREDLAEAAAAQARELAFYTNWSYAHPPAIELAARVAELAPGDLNRVFFTSGGSEAVDSALKLCRQFHKLNGEPGRFKVIARDMAYHGTTMGALSVTGIPALRTPFEPIFPGSSHVPNTNTYRLADGADLAQLAESIRERILFEGPDTVSAVFLEPVQNSGGCYVAPPGYFQRVRDICDEFGVLLVSDEVICSWGRLGSYFGAERLGYQPDLITTAKGITSAYAPMGAVIASDRVAAPFMEGKNSFVHGITFGGHPVAAAVALAALDAYESEGIMEHVRTHEGALQEMLESLRDIPLVGDVRGMGYFWAIELVKDRETKQPFADAEERDRLLRGFLGPELFKRGLICRADDRGGPAILQFSPPLIAGPEHFAEMEAALRPVLEEAASRL